MYSFRIFRIRHIDRADAHVVQIIQQAQCIDSLRIKRVKIVSQLQVIAGGEDIVDTQLIDAKVAMRRRQVGSNGNGFLVKRHGLTVTVRDDVKVRRNGINITVPGVVLQGSFNPGLE